MMKLERERSCWMKWIHGSENITTGSVVINSSCSANKSKARKEQKKKADSKRWKRSKGTGNKSN